MKWLLIANVTKPNPGDLAVMWGVKRIIRAVDPKPVFDLVERDHGDKIYEPRKFDFAVSCGMPAVWSHSTTIGGKIKECSSRTHGAWAPLSGWLADSGRLIMAGFGLYLFYDRFPDTVRVFAPDAIKEFKSKILDRCILAYSRSDRSKEFFPGIESLPCPSIFAGSHLPTVEKDLKLFNAMPGGAHYPGCDTTQSEAWNRRLPEISESFKRRGFKFVAHNRPEAFLATRELGWPEEDCYQFDGDMEKFLRIYSRCSHYFGNRIHGAILARSFGASVRCVGYDSRLEAVSKVGGSGARPSFFEDSPCLDRWASCPVQDPKIETEREFNHQVGLFKSILSNPQTRTDAFD